MPAMIHDSYRPEKCQALGEETITNYDKYLRFETISGLRIKSGTSQLRSEHVPHHETAVASQSH